MKIFVDTGNIKDIEALASLGIIDGVTTNPSLMAKETRRLHDISEGDLPHRAGSGERRGGGRPTPTA